MEVDDVTNSSVSDGWTEDWDLVLPTPVVNAVFVVNGLTKSVNDFARCKDLTSLLGIQIHVVNLRHHKGLQLTVGGIGHNYVANPVDSLESHFSAVEEEVSHVVRSHTLHEILFKTSTRSDDAVNHLVLAEILNVLSHSTRRHV